MIVILPARAVYRRIQRVSHWHHRLYKPSSRRAGGLTLNRLVCILT